MSAPTITPPTPSSFQDTATSAFITGWALADPSAPWTPELTAELLDVLANDDQAGIYSRQYLEHVATKALASLGIEDPRPPLPIAARRRWVRRNRHHLSWWPPRRRRAVRVDSLLTRGGAE